MVSHDESPLTPLAQEALDALWRTLPEEGEFTYEHAYTVLGKEGNLERSTVEDIIERLYNNDYVYEVEGNIRLTGC